MKIIPTFNKDEINNIKNVLLDEGLSEEEVTFNIDPFNNEEEYRLFYNITDNFFKNKYGFFCIKGPDKNELPVLEYFLIYKEYRNKKNNIYIDAAKMIKDILILVGFDKCIIDVKNSGKFKYLSKIVEKTTNTYAYKVSKNSACFLVNLKELSL